MSTNYLINDIRVQANRMEVVACRHFGHHYLLEDFFVEYDKDTDLGTIDPAIVQIPYLLNVLPVIWISGEQYRIAKLDRQFAQSVQFVKEAYRAMYPELEWSGELVPDRLTDITIENSPVADQMDTIGILFSGGVDSVCTSLRYIQQKQILITVWGANVALENRRGWDIVAEQCRNFGKLYGHRNLFIKSNFARFLYTSKLKTYSRKIPNWWTHVQHGPGLAGLAAPVLWKFGARKLLIASTHSSEFHAEWGSDQSIDNSLKWPGVFVRHDAYELSRQDKLEKIAEVVTELNTPKPFLYVCFSETRSQGDNCCECEKCLRTITGLLLECQNIRDYGFDISPNDALNAARTKFNEGTMPIDENSAYFWSDLQNRANERLSQPSVNCESSDWTMFDWLVRINIDEYQEKYQRINLSNYRLLEILRSCTKFILNRIPVVDRPIQKAIARYQFWRSSRH